MRELGWPSWIVDLRHDGTHGNLPSLEMCRFAAESLLGLLYTKFWAAQAEALSQMKEIVEQRQAQNQNASTSSSSSSSSSSSPNAQTAHAQNQNDTDDEAADGALNKWKQRCAEGFQIDEDAETAGALESFMYGRSSSSTSALSTFESMLAATEEEAVKRKEVEAKAAEKAAAAAEKATSKGGKVEKKDAKSKKEDYKARKLAMKSGQGGKRAKTMSK